MRPATYWLPVASGGSSSSGAGTVADEPTLPDGHPPVPPLSSLLPSSVRVSHADLLRVPLLEELLAVLERDG